MEHEMKNILIQKLNNTFFCSFKSPKVVCMILSVV